MAFGEAERGADWAAFWTHHAAGNGPQSLAGEGVVPLLERWLGAETVMIGNLPWVKNLVSELVVPVRERLAGLEIRAALVHGDFTPWNLRHDGEELVAIDWEWAREDGLAGIDLGHGLVMEAKLVKGLVGEELVEGLLKMAEEGEISAYLEQAGWEDLTLWCLLSVLYSSDQAGVELEKELRVLENRVELSLAI